jgi:pimeloyl-ACP methyl ester carboxylesterase
VEPLSEGAINRAECRVDVTDVAPPGCRALALEVAFHGAPRPGAQLPVLFCFPGGGMSRAYFDLAPAGYSFAEYMARRGFLVVLVDHPGVGGSDTPADGWTLTPSVIAAVEARATVRVIELLRSGEIDGIGAIEPGPVVGVGHSTGAAILIHQQAQHRPYDAVCLLGWAGRGLPDVLTDDEQALADGAVTDAALVAAARSRFAEPLPLLPRGSSRMLVASALSRDVRAAMAQARARLLAVAGSSTMIPGSAASAARLIEVPIFLGVGEHDIALDPHRVPAEFPSARDVTLFVLPEAGHNHNVEPTREFLWARIAVWAKTVAAPASHRARAT